MDLFDKLNDKYSNYAKSITAKQTGLYPYFHCLQTRQAPEVIMEGKRTIMLGSNNYLGLTSEPEIIEAGKKAGIERPQREPVQRTNFIR